MRIIPLSALAFLLASPPALAQSDRGAYLFLNLGYTSSTTRNAPSAGTEVLTGAGFTNVGERDTSTGRALGLGTGYRFNRFVAMEGAYYDLGDVHRYTGTFTMQVGVAQESAGVVKTWRAKAGELALLGSLPITQTVSLVGKVSAVHMRGKFDSDLDCTDGCTRRVVSSSGAATSAGFGAGVAIRPEQHLSFALMAESWQVKAGTFGAEGEDLGKLRLFSLRLNYHF